MLQTFAFQPAASRPAVVSKTCDHDPEYLRLEPNGATAWVADPAKATAFGSMKEATRMALRLPASTRAYGLPLQVELELYSEPSLH